MPTWVNGAPRDNGATDLEDSARLAGMMAVARMAPLPEPIKYITYDERLGRWYDSRLPFTRDQLLPLAYFAKETAIIGSIHTMGLGQLTALLEAAANKLTAPNGKDPLLPHHKAHIRSCVTGKPQYGLLAKACLYLECLFHAAYKRGLSEPNQLICMLLTAGPSWVKLWKHLNPKWRESIVVYWCGWRNEVELANGIIKRLEEEEEC